MTDTETPQEPTEQPAPKPKRGRPKKRLARSDHTPLRQRMREPVHEPRSVRVDDDFAYQPFESRDPLHIDDEVLRSIEHDYGYRLQWCVESVLGQPQDEIMSAHRKNKFQEVRKGSFGGQLDYLADREGRIAK